jgi:hypothetical protein
MRGNSGTFYELEMLDQKTQILLGNFHWAMRGEREMGSELHRRHSPIFGENISLQRGVLSIYTESVQQGVARRNALCLPVPSSTPSRLFVNHVTERKT